MDDFQVSTLRKNAVAPNMTLAEAEAVVNMKLGPRVTKQLIESKISQIRYMYDSSGTFCIIKMNNQFEVHGFSKPADPDNYDRMVGERYAYENAFRQLWQLEGYLLCERIYKPREAS